MRKTIIFDLDGTLYPSAQLPVTLFANYFHQEISKLDISEENRVVISRRCKAQNKAGLYNYIRELLECDDEKFHTFCNKIIDKIDYSLITPNPELLKVLNFLKQHYNVVVFTNNVDSHVRKVFKKLFDTEYIGVDVYDICSMEKDGYFHSKRTDGLSLFCEKLGLNSKDCILIDDLPANIVAASKIKMHSVLVGSNQDIVKILKDIFC